MKYFKIEQLVNGAIDVTVIEQGEWLTRPFNAIEITKEEYDQLSPRKGASSPVKAWEFVFESEHKRTRVLARGQKLGYALEKALDELQTGSESLRDDWKLQHLVKIELL